MDNLFRYVNSFPMPLWLAMMFAPKHPLTVRAARSWPIFALAGVNYIITLVVAVRQGQREPGGVKLDFMSLEGVHAGLGTRQGTLAAWAHMLALDLFAGAWIYRECERIDAPAAVRVPALLATLMAGPGGLLAFLIWRLAAGNGRPIGD